MFCLRSRVVYTCHLKNVHYLVFVPRAGSEELQVALRPFILRQFVLAGLVDALAAALDPTGQGIDNRTFYGSDQPIND